MSNVQRPLFAWLTSVWISVVIPGCGGSSPPKPNPSPSPATTTTQSSANSSTTPAASATRETTEPGFGPVVLGGGTGSAGETKSAKPALPPEKQLDEIRKALKPIQVVLGKWHAIIDKSKEYEDLQWVWDWKSDRAQPALTMSVEGDGVYFQTARLTYLPEAEKFRLTLTHKDGTTRVLEGTFREEPTDKPGEDAKQTPQRTFKLELTEIGDAKDRWQIVLNQQENNRYLLELSKARGKNFFRFDTIASQREGTSFALNDSDFKERTCVISQGLGTIQVSYNGKSYWVCCSGCKAAFEEDPKKWIAKFEAMQEK